LIWSFHYTGYTFVVSHLTFLARRVKKGRREEQGEKSALLFKEREELLDKFWSLDPAVLLFLDFADSSSAVNVTASRTVSANVAAPDPSICKRRVRTAVYAPKSVVFGNISWRLQLALHVDSPPPKLGATTGPRKPRGGRPREAVSVNWNNTFHPFVCWLNSGTGRMSHLKDVNRRFRNGFREGGAATKKTKAEASS
jgi:hypothetical protein